MTGREPPSGKRNLDIAKKNLSRYLEYKLLKDVDPKEKSTRKVIVTEIHDPPLPAEDHRGEHGTYIDDLRPLLLGKTAFEGKMYELCNTVGLFLRYIRELRNMPTMKDSFRYGRFGANPWKSDEKGPIGEAAYRSIIAKQTRDKVEFTLNSLQKKGIIFFEEFYKISPDLFCLVDPDEIDEFKYRKKSWDELVKERATYLKKIKGAAKRKNSLLNVELASALINGIDLDDPSVKSAYTVYGERQEQLPERCSEKQVEAIENYGLYVRQLAYAQYFKQKSLPTIDVEEVSNQGKFFLNPALARIYFAIDKNLKKQLFGEVNFWKEIRYEIIDPEKAIAYRPDGFDQDGELADNVTRKILDYMESQMDTRQMKVAKEYLSDFPFFGEAAGHLFRLSDSKSAQALHHHLRDLYGMTGSE